MVGIQYWYCNMAIPVPVYRSRLLLQYCNTRVACYLVLFQWQVRHAILEYHAISGHNACFVNCIGNSNATPVHYLVLKRFFLTITHD